MASTATDGWPWSTRSNGSSSSPSLHLALRIAGYFDVPVEVVFSTEPFPRLGSGRAG
ncbi:hypothetical protein [Nostocoides australiense]